MTRFIPTNKIKIHAFLSLISAALSLSVLKWDYDAPCHFISILMKNGDWPSIPPTSMSNSKARQGYLHKTMKQIITKYKRLKMIFEVLSNTHLKWWGRDMRERRKYMTLFIPVKRKNLTLWSIPYRWLAVIPEERQGYEVLQTGLQLLEKFQFPRRRILSAEELKFPAFYSINKEHKV